MPDFKEVYRPIFSNNKNRSSASLFEARKFYLEESFKWATKTRFLDNFTDAFEGDFESKYKIPFGDLLKTNFLYGVIDFDGDLIMPIEDQKNFSVIGTDSQGKVIKLQNFMADAFLDLKKYLNIQSLKGDIKKTSFFHNFQAKKGYQSFDELYTANGIVLAERFREIVLLDRSLDSKINSMKDFIIYFLEFLCTKNFSYCPITKSGLALSYYLRFYTNGITTLISEEDFGDDNKKYNMLVDDSCHCFANACIRFGFNMDINVPYIMYANLNSPALKKYYNKYGIKDTKDLFKKRYKKIYLDDIDGLKELFYNAYSVFLVNNGIYAKDLNKLCAWQARKSAYQKREEVSKDKFNKDFSDSFWLSMLIYIKNLETEAGITQERYDTLIELSKKYLLVNKKNEFLKLLNKEMPFKYKNNFPGSVQQDASVIEPPPQPSSRPKLIFRG